MSDISKKRNIGIYCGSFNPFHIGHLDVVNQAIEVFDDVLVAKGINPEKENLDKLDYPLPINFLSRLGVKAVTYNTLLTDFVKIWEPEYNVTLVRGLRNGADLEYEQNIVAFLKGMYHNIKVVAFYADPKYRHISSGAVRAIEKFSETEYKKYVVSN